MKNEVTHLPKLGYSVNEFSCASSVGRSKLYKDINAGILKVHKIGTRTVILPEDGKAYLTNAPIGEYPVSKKILNV